MLVGQSATQAADGEHYQTFVVKNTFIDSIDDVADATPKRSSSWPPSARFSDVEVSTTYTEDDASSVVTAASLFGTLSDSLPNLDMVKPAQESDQRDAQLPFKEPFETRLNVSAKPWCPQVSAANAFAQQMETLVTIVKIALSSSVWIRYAEVHEIKDGDIESWCIIAWLPFQNFQHYDELVMLAKNAILDAISSSTNVTLSGYRANPFVTTPVGFEANFAGLHDKRKACRGLLQTGFCVNGSACRWQHPVFRSKIHVKVMLPE